MPRVIENHERIIDAFRAVEVVSELVAQLPNGEFKNELDMDIILFGRSYRGKKVGPYVRLLDCSPGEVIVREKTWESSIFYILVKGTLEASITESDGSRRKVGEIPAGNSFGEMALLSGTPRTATVAVADGNDDALVLEFTRPAIRLLRKFSKFGRLLDRNYRSYGLSLTLNEIKDFARSDIDADVLKRLDDASRFAVYEKDHILFREGDPINRVLFVRNGWIQRVSGVEFNPAAADLLLEGDESVGLDFLGAGSCLGLEAIDTPGQWKYTATVRGRAEVMEVAVTRLREDKELGDAVIPFLRTSAGDESLVPQHPEDTRVVSATTREIETGVVDGINLLVMDMAKCVRCGNCSFACHEVHGHSRLVRRGIHIERPKKPNASIQSVLAPSVCMHCQDAECLTGCPTGAIARFPNGEVDINTVTCIGCGDCATQCPYNAISMIERATPVNGDGNGFIAKVLSPFNIRPDKTPPPVTQTENLLAIKCNLCKDTGLNPEGSTHQAYSCEENCPTGALVRVNPREYFDEVNQTMGLIRKSKTHAIGENIHKGDTWARIWHFIGIVLVIALGGGAIWATLRYAQDVALSPGSWVTMRWLTGLTGLASIVWVMLYPFRKKIYRRRAGALRYWMLSHIYLGIVAGVVLLVHGGMTSGGLLTTALMVSFDMVIFSGLFGAACYVIVPRFMTKIEREPLLLEDLEARRDELRAELIQTAEQTDNPKLKNLLERKVRRRFLGLGYLFRQYLKREDLATMLADARQRFRPDAEEFSRIEDARLMEAVENAATLRRVDALIYLHKLLKLWLPPHVLFTSLMLVLMAVHIAQVVYFNVR